MTGDEYAQAAAICEKNAVKCLGDGDYQEGILHALLGISQRLAQANENAWAQIARPN